MAIVVVGRFELSEKKTGLNLQFFLNDRIEPVEVKRHTEDTRQSSLVFACHNQSRKWTEQICIYFVVNRIKQNVGKLFSSQKRNQASEKVSAAAREKICLNVPQNRCVNAGIMKSNENMTGVCQKSRQKWCCH